MNVMGENYFLNYFRVVEPFITVMKKDSSWMCRLVAARVLGKIGGDSAIISLVDALKDTAINGDVAEILSNHETIDIRVNKALINALKGKNISIIAGAYKFFIKKGIQGTENLLTQALYKCGNKDMAQDFMNSDNAKLQNAAYDWAKKNGYLVIPGGGGGIKWGR
jgi:hypothetical protein